MSIEVGQIVKFAAPYNSDEAAARFKVVELRGDRVLLEMSGPKFEGWALKPQTVYPLADMVGEEA